MQINQPHNPQLEREMLMCCFFDGEILDSIDLDADDFYSPKNFELFRSMKNLRALGNAIDPATIETELTNRGVLAKAGGRDSILLLGNTIPQVYNAETYARILRQLSIRRRVISECLSCADLASNSPDKFEELLTKISTRISSATDTTSVSDNCKSAHEALREAVEHVKEVHAGRENSNAVYTGLVDVDKKLCGLWPGEVVVIAGRPGMGKSALAMDILKSVAEKGKAAIFFSLEMSRYLLSLRLLAGETEINSSAIRTGNIGESNFEKLDCSVEKYKGLPLYIDDTATLKTDRIYSVCRKKQKQYGSIGIIAVDYLQLMQGASRNGNREQAVAEISRSLKIISKEFNCAVLALSQLNRAVEYQKDSRPTMSHLRESGAIEQDADTILFIYRDEIYHEDSKDKGTAEIIVGKARSGSTGMVRVRFVSEFTKFQNLTIGTDRAIENAWNETDY